MQVPTRYGTEEVPSLRMSTGKTVCPFCKEKTPKNEKVVYLVINSGPMGGAFVCLSCAAQFNAELGNLLNPDPNFVKSPSPCDIENNPGIQMRNALLGSIGQMMGELGVNAVQIGNSAIEAKKPDIPTEPLVGYGDTIVPGNIVFIYNEDGSPDFSPWVRDEYLYSEADRKKWYNDKNKKHNPEKVVSYSYRFYRKM